MTARDERQLLSSADELAAARRPRATTGLMRLLVDPCTCCSPRTQKAGMYVLALSMLLPGIASLAVLGAGSIVTLLLRVVAGPFVMLAVKLAIKHLYPTSLGKLHLVAYRAHKWWTGETLHSRTTRVPLAGSACCVYTIACFVDNYCYAIVDTSGDGPCAVALVDPADAPAVLAQLRAISEQWHAERGLRVEAILTTHKHWDHQGGNAQLCQALPGLRVYGGARDEVLGCTHPVRDRDVIELGGLRIEVIDAPGHTVGSVMFMLHAPQPALFTGDTLFCGGCGAPMEGTVADLQASFARIWRRLAPRPHALIFPGHEYTEMLLSSCIADPASCPSDKASAYARLASALLKARRRRSAPGLPLPTVPTCLADELAFNPYFGKLHEAATILQEACRARGARLAAADEGYWKPPPPRDADELIPSMQPLDALATDELAADAPGLPSGALPPERNPTFVLVSTELVRSLSALRSQRRRTLTDERAPSPSEDGGTSPSLARDGSLDADADGAALGALRAQLAHVEHGADDWAAKRERRLREYLVARRALGEEHGASVVLRALSQFGCREGHVEVSALTRALTTLGFDLPLSSDEAGALVRAAREHDAALAAASPAGLAPPLVAGCVSARAIVALLAAAVDEMRPPRTQSLGERLRRCWRGPGQAVEDEAGKARSLPPVAPESAHGPPSLGVIEASDVVLSA
jgi:hydroxyacylglutathione hydrolase